MKIASLLYHNNVECPLCGVLLKSTDEIEFDHFHALALGGAHDDTNIQAVHVECHRTKTFGSKSTTYGSDIHAIAKVKRLTNPSKRLKRKWPSRRFEKRLTKGVKVTI